MTPLERAAKALRELDDPLQLDDGSWMTQGGLVNDDHWIEIARAVIAAIREPSEDFLARVAPKTDGNNARVLWQHMIDALLAEGE